MTVDIEILETEYVGGMKVRVADVEITNYDSSGEAFQPLDLGMYRFQNLQITPSGSTMFAYSYDWDTEKLHLDIPGGDSEQLRVVAYGR